jgi:predicted alpha/beta hydrolase family esterase
MKAGYSMATAFPLSAGTAPVTVPVTVIIPGLGDSGDDHWQTRWQHADPASRRVVQSDWHEPDLASWLGALGETLDRCSRPVLLVAHSLGCWLTAHYALRFGADRIAGAFLVAPADVEHTAAAPNDLRRLPPLPDVPLPFPSLVVASSNDPYMSLPRARAVAATWGASLFEAGAVGHINAQSGHGPWPEGQALLRDWRAAQVLPAALRSVG